jgi:hypothetical protein
MNYLEKYSDGEITCDVLDVNRDSGWDILSKYDIVFFHRPCRQVDHTLMCISKYLNVLTWVDYDDWLFEVPEWNQSREIYNNPYVQQIMIKMILCADVVTCSTQALQNKFLIINKNTVLVPNAYRSDLFTYRDEVPDEREQKVIWRGTTTHEGDLQSVLPALSNLPYFIEFLGAPPFSVTSKINVNNYSCHREQDLFLYFKDIYKRRPKVVVFPLVDCFFNQCKSNIAYIEALHAGAMCVAPDFPEFRKPGVCTYTPGNSESFLHAVDGVMALDQEGHAEMVKTAFTTMKSLYDISIVNEIRIGIISCMMKNGYPKNTMDPWNHDSVFKALAEIKENE